MSPATLVELLERAVDDELALRFGGRAPLPLSLLQRRATTVARALRWRGLGPGDCALLALADTADFLVAFWATLYAGAIAVPLPPLAADEADPAGTLGRVAAHLGHPLTLVDAGQAARRPDAIDVQSLVQAASFAAPLRDPRDGPALLRFAPSSSNPPLGFTLTHDNLLANVRQLAQLLGLNDDDRVLSWVPLWHPLGLLAGHLLPLWARCAHGERSPARGAPDPMAALSFAASFQPTVLVARPSALAEVATAAASLLDRGALAARPDPGGVRRLLIGAEAVAPAALRAHLRGCGLDEATVVPLYTHGAAGLAACAARSPGIGTVPVQGREVLRLGAPLPGVRVRVVDLDDRAVEAGVVGDVEIDGPNVSRGYWAAPGATSALFDDGWLRTGDRGVLVDGELACVMDDDALRG